MSKYLFADRIKDLEGSAIRNSLKFGSRTEIISFAGGLPAPEMFPSRELAEIAHNLLLNNSASALQYGVTEGYAPLIELMENMMTSKGVFNQHDQLIIVSGAQQTIDLATRALVNEGEGVMCENPSFVGGLNCFRVNNTRLFPVDMEQDGLNIEQAEQTLRSNNVKLIYTIPTFQNPSGITMSLEKRKALIDLAEKYNVYVIEDNPYEDLRFRGENIQTLKEMDKNGRIIYGGSFSKILSPGMRVGWTVANAEIIQKMVVIKQVADVHTPILTQMMALEYLRQYDINAHIEKIRELYKKRCLLMLECIDKYFPETCCCTRPEGGLFILCTMTNNIDSRIVTQKALDSNIAIIPGTTFMSDTTQISYSFRLNFSNMSEENIEKGIFILGNVLKELS